MASMSKRKLLHAFDCGMNGVVIWFCLRCWRRCGRGDRLPSSSDKKSPTWDWTKPEIIMRSCQHEHNALIHTRHWQKTSRWYSTRSLLKIRNLFLANCVIRLSYLEINMITHFFLSPFLLCGKARLLGNDFRPWALVCCASVATRTRCADGNLARNDASLEYPANECQDILKCTSEYCNCIKMCAFKLTAVDLLLFPSPRDVARVESRLCLMKKNSWVYDHDMTNHEHQVRFTFQSSEFDLCTLRSCFANS